MSQPQLQARDDGHLYLSGELSMATVPGLARQGLASLAAGLDAEAEWVIDLAGVTRADSAGLALLIHWRREAQAGQHRLHFQNIPPKMLAIAQVSGVDQLLALN
jgi:phospholipid transport system transporter-binding protein